jgi:hypothetical protein
MWVSLATLLWPERGREGEKPSRYLAREKENRQLQRGVFKPTVPMKGVLDPIRAGKTWQADNKPDKGTAGPPLPLSHR